jgi:hypothetical protein
VVCILAVELYNLFPHLKHHFLSIPLAFLKKISLVPVVFTMAARSLSLWNRIHSVTINAKKTGAIFSIDTDQEIIKDHGVEVQGLYMCLLSCALGHAYFNTNRMQFIVSISKALNKKPVGDVNAKKPDAKKANPFLPCEPDLFVQEICGTHNLVLNKFNVVDYHLILATVDFQHQSEPLNAKDFTAL